MSTTPLDMYEAFIGLYLGTTPSITIGERERRLKAVSPVWTRSASLLSPGSCLTAPIQMRVESETLDRLRDPLLHLERLSRLERNWDSYGGRPITPEAILQTIQVLIRILSTDATAPSIVPTSEGGIQLEWHPSDADLEMSIHANGTIDVYLETAGGQIWEGPLVDSRWQVEEFLAFVAERPPASAV